MSARRDFSRRAAARLLDTTPAALVRQVRRNGRCLSDGSQTLDGVTIGAGRRGIRIHLAGCWTSPGASDWLTVEHMAPELGVSRPMLGKRLEPGRRGSARRLLEFEVRGRQLQARKLGRLWRLRVLTGVRAGNEEAA